MQQKLLDEVEPQTLQQQENISIKGQSARALVMQKLMRKAEVNTTLRISVSLLFELVKIYRCKTKHNITFYIYMLSRELSYFAIWWVQKMLTKRCRKKSLTNVQSKLSYILKGAV